MTMQYQIPAWKTAPFIRLLVPMAAGILMQWYLSFEIEYILACAVVLVSAQVWLHFFPVSRKFRFRTATGIALEMVVLSAGMLLTWNADIRNKPAWVGHGYNDSSWLVIRINEPLVEKERSDKAEGIIESARSNTWISTKGTVLVYFARDSGAAALRYGDRILTRKPLQPVRNSGNPGAFDYQRYAGFQGIFHSLYLQKNDFVVLAESRRDRFTHFIFETRAHIVGVLQKYVTDTAATGIAEALLIGYKEDLDKSLLQAYSNAGVVHIIAISGLHLGLIYFMLSWVLSRIPVLKKNALIKMLLILGSLWLFAILTGSSASVLRSAVMFSCILFGNTWFRKSSVYNSLAASAFILLCYNPYFLWDVGFQLSYLALVGIVWLQQPIGRMIYFPNKWVARIWKMAAVTISAQLAAFPLCIYYFHQFPNLFLLTNLLAVPLSTAILFAEIFLLCFCWAGPVAVLSGKLISLLIVGMNYFIQVCNSLPWSVWNGLYATVMTTWLLYGIVFCACGWLLWRNRKLLWVCLIFILFFSAAHIYEKLVSRNRQRIVVYNIARHQAIDSTLR